MQRTTITLPEVALLAGTRVALGAGIGLLLSIVFAKSTAAPLAGRSLRLACSRPFRLPQKCSRIVKRTVRKSPTGCCDDVTRVSNPCERLGSKAIASNR
jgi:hypothetical protein